MTEQYGFRFVVDANDAAKGWKQFESAVDGVFRSLDRMESHVEKTMGAVNKATQGGKRNIAAFTKAAQELGRIKVNPTATRNITALNAAMKGFKAPSNTQVRNTTAFFQALEKSGTGGGAAAARNIATLNAAMNGFKAPTASNVTNLRELFKALALYPSGKNFTNAAGMLSTLRQLSGFKAPSAAQVRNLQQFLNTVANLRIPQNGAQIARNLEQIARAATVANRDLRGLRSNIGSFNFGRFNSEVRGATVNMMGLQNAFSATYQMGSVLRSLFGALTLGELARGFFTASNAALTFDAQMSVINRSTAFAAEQMEFVRNTVNSLGLDLLTAQEGFAKIAIAADKTGLSMTQTHEIFKGFSTAMSVLNLSTSKQGDTWLALQQVMNKGYLSAEELNQQLNEKLPGAMAYATEYANKLGMSLETGLKKKALDAAGVLAHISKRMQEDFGPAIEKALNRPSTQMTLLKNKINVFYQELGKAGGNQAFLNLLKTINSYITPEAIDHYAQVIGEKLLTAVDRVTAAIRWMHDNWDELKGPLSTALSLIGHWAIISGTLQIGRFIVSPIANAVIAFRNFIPVAQQSLLLMRAMTATSFGGLAASVRGMNPATLALLTNIRGISTAIKTFAKNPFASMRTGLVSMGTATDGVTGKFLKLGAAISTGIAIAMSVARDENKAYAHDSYSTTEIVKGFFLTLGDNISSMWNSVMNWFAEKFDGVGTWISQKVSWLGDFFKAFFINLSFGFSKVGEGIYLTFKSAFDAVVGMVRNAGTALYKLFTGDFAGAGQAAMNVFSAPFNAFKSNFKGYVTDLPGQRDAYAASAERGYEAFSNQLASYGKRGRGPLAAGGARGTVQPDLLTPEKQKALLKDDEDDKKNKKKKPRKGPKPPDPMKELERLQNKADQIMKRLAEDNPLLKLQQEYVEDLTKQAQTLLTDGGYEKWMKQIAANGGDAAATMMELQDALTGAGVDQAVLKDLATRYGVTVDDLTNALERQNKAYERKRKEIELEQTFGGPLLKQKLEELQLARLSTSQQQVLSEVMEEVNRWKGTDNELTQKQIDLLTEQLTLQQRRIELLNAEREFYENNGLREYQNNIRTVGEMVHDLDKEFLGSLEEQLFSVGTTGKFSFSAIFDTIQQGLVRWSAQGITNAIGGLMSDGDSNNPTIFGGLMKSMGFKNTGFDSAVANQRIDAQNVVLYGARVNTKGDLFGEGFGNILDGINGGIGPNDEIIVNGKKPWNIEDEMTRPLLSATEQVGQTISQDWGQQIRGLGGVLNSIVGGLGGTGGGSGGLLGGLLNIGMSVIGSGGKGTPAAKPGVFKEGGYSTQPVTRWSNAPHYSEGTHNTTPGIPAVLHDNEAVIPLSRGRKVPVTLTNGGGNGSGTVINNNWNIQTPNADSFRRSQQQMTGQMHRAAQRSYIRNN